jgi:hypothetical protein
MHDTIKIEAIYKYSITSYEFNQDSDINCNIIVLKDACFVQRFYEILVGTRDVRPQSAHAQPAHA